MPAETPPTRRDRRAEERVVHRHEPRAAKQPRKLPGLGILSALALVGGLAVIAVAIALGGGKTSTPVSSIIAVRMPVDLPSDGFVLGEADAPVTLDLYEDFQCPACQMWEQSAFPQLRDNEIAAGTVKLVYHDLAFLGDESVAAAHAGYAAAQQGRFWDMWATLYANQSRRENSGGFSDDRILAMATALGLDLVRFKQDMASSGAADSLTASQDAARGLGITSTPTIALNGVVLSSGVQPYPDLAAAIVKLLP